MNQDNHIREETCLFHEGLTERMRGLEKQRENDREAVKGLRICIGAKLEKKIFYSVLSLLVMSILAFGGLSLHNTDSVNQKVDRLVHEIGGLTIEVKVMQERMASQSDRMRNLENCVNNNPNGR